MDPRQIFNNHTYLNRGEVESGGGRGDVEVHSGGVGSGGGGEAPGGGGEAA